MLNGINISNVNGVLKVETEEEKKEEVVEEEPKPKFIKGTPVPTGGRSWGSVCVVLILVFAVVYSLTFLDNPSGDLSEEEIQEKTLDFINNKLLAGSEEIASVISITEDNGVYVLDLEVNDQPFRSYATTNGRLLFPDAIDMVDIHFNLQQPIEKEVEKTEKPEVELFIMSHCPYGTQAEKGIIPVIELLGDKADIEIKFVYYAMHGEVEVKEQLLQYCINKEQPDKYLTYLKCFLEEGNNDNCLEGIDVGLCVTNANTEFKVMENLADTTTYLSGNYPLFDIHKEENEKYAVGGSPTLVINGVSVQVNRDPQTFLNTICSYFLEAPEECNTELSSIVPTPGFGFGGEGAATTASCG